MIPSSKKRAFSFHELIMYLALAGKHIRLVTLLFIFVCLVSLNYYVYVRPVYYCAAVADLTWIPKVNESAGDLNYRLNGLMYSLQSTTTLERTARSLGIDEDAHFLQKRYFPKIHVTRTGKRADIEVWATKLELAKRYPEKLINGYLTFRQENLAHIREEMSKAYMDQMNHIDKKMDQSMEERAEKRTEQNIMRKMIELREISDVPVQLVKTAKRLDELGRVRTRLLDSSLDVVAKLSIIESARNEDQLSIGQEVNTPRDEPFQTIPAEKESKAEAEKPQMRVVVVPSMVKQDQAWRELERQRIEIKGDIADALRIYREGNRKVIILEKKLELIERSLEMEFQTQSDRLGVEYQDLLNRKHDLEAKLPEYEEINKEAAKVMRDSAIFDASRLSLQEPYIAMKRQLEEMDYRGDQFQFDMTYRGIAELKETPESPNRAKLALFTIAIALAVSFGIPFALEYLDHTLSNMEQVESTFQLRGLGIVPKLADDRTATSVLIDREKSTENNLIENFRVIRTNLISMGALSKPPQVMMVTSSMPKEGKTIVSSNLAISFSQTGAKTILMDTDLRRGRLHRLFGYRKSPGLSDVLLGNATLAEACRPTIYDNLTILSAGAHLDTGTELLGSKRFEEIMAEMRSKYDRVVIDTPPVLGLSDTSVMQPHVDGVLFVIWSGKTPIRNMKAAMEMLYTNGANFYGFVLNRLDLSSTTNYYQYYYYSHDYYYHTTHALENA